MSFNALKKNRSASIEKLVASAQAIGGQEKGSRNEDDKFWKPTVDKAGNGYAVLRFLPAPEGEDVPWARFWDHGFQGPTGKWYIENSLTTIGQPDPVSELNSKLWNSGIESDKDQVRKQKRRQHFAANVYVVSDPGNPANEGKVFMFKFGKKIFDKIMDVMQPQFQDEEPMNPFDFWEGADFKLKIRQVEGYRNYDKSEFDSPEPLSEDEDDLERIWNTEYALNEFISETNFKTYDELKERLNFVLDLNQEVSRVERPMPTREEPVVQTRKETVEEASDDPWSSEDDDDGLTYFEKLAEG